eukprot:gene2125-2823_t
MYNPEWKRKGQKNKVLDMGKKPSRSCLMGLRAATPELVSQERHDELKATFPLPLKVEDVVRTRNPERLPATWDLPLLLTRAHTRASTVTSDLLLKARYTMAEQFNVCFDGATHKKTDVEKEASNLINVQEVVAFMREANRLMQAATRKKRRGGKQQKRQKRPSSSDGTDASDDESSSGLDECLADRKMRVVPQKENLPDDYTFEYMTPGSFAVTVAGGDDTDKCWFDVMLLGHDEIVHMWEIDDGETVDSIPSEFYDEIINKPTDIMKAKKEQA